VTWEKGYQPANDAYCGTNLLQNVGGAATSGQELCPLPQWVGVDAGGRGNACYQR